MILFAENRNSVDITGTLLVFLVPEDTVFRRSKLKVGTKVGTVMGTITFPHALIRDTVSTFAALGVSRIAPCNHKLVSCIHLQETVFAKSTEPCSKSDAIKVKRDKFASYYIFGLYDGMAF